MVASEDAKSDLSSIPRRFGGLEGLHLEVVVLQPGGGAGDLGTADAIRLVSPQLVSPRLMVVSCDLVTDVQIHNLTDLHRVHGAAVTALFSRSPDLKATAVPGPKSKPKKGERHQIGWKGLAFFICSMFQRRT